ncbi:MAG: hypothetical protein M1823_004319 [Watsoniomyces obsoletus]|nr:MAG: hypothetical protein M1823_004319 [Watsoniomyces obsoletus]
MYLFHLPSLLLLLGPIASRGAPVAQDDDSGSSGSSGSTSLTPTSREAVVAAGGGLLGGATVALISKINSGKIPDGPPLVPGGLEIMPPPPEQLAPGPIRPLPSYGSDTWVGVLTHGLYEPDDAEGRCIEDCIQAALHYASVYRRTLKMVEEYETCRGPGVDNCDVFETSKYKSYETLYYVLWLQQEDLRKKEQTAAAMAEKLQKQNRKRAGSQRISFSLADVPKVVQGRVRSAIQGTNLNKMASDLGAGAASQARKIPKTIVPSLSAAGLRFKGAPMLKAGL